MQVDLQSHLLKKSTVLNKRTVLDLSFFDVNTSISFTKDDRQEALYNFWKSAWEKSFSDLGYKERQQLFSDDFYAKRILAFFDKDKPVGCIFLESYDLSIESHRHSRYLQTFPKDMFDVLLSKGLRKAYALSNLAIDPEWRKSQTDLQLSQLLTSIGVWKACQDLGDVVLGCTRNDRKVNNILENHNSTKYASDERYNCSVDFTYIDLKQAKVFPDKDLMDACLYFTSGHFFNISNNATA